MAWSKYDSTGAQLEGALTDFPVGTVVSWAADSAPSGWLKCDGTAISRTGYPELFGVVGTSYGTGNGSTTFNLPTSDGEIILTTSNTTRLNVNTPPQYVANLPSVPTDGQEVYLATPVLSMATPVGIIQHRRYNAAATRWDYVGSTAPYYATALPATPAGTQDGLEVYYAADATNGVVWHLRYNALSTSAYKWEFVGGAPVRTASTSVADENTHGTSSGAAFSNAITRDVPLRGQYRVGISYHCLVSSRTINTESIYVWMGVRPQSGSAIIDEDYTASYIGPTTSYNTNYNAGIRHSASVQTNTTLTTQLTLEGIYGASMASGSGVVRFRYREITAFPVRVA